MCYLCRKLRFFKLLPTTRESIGIISLIEYFLSSFNSLFIFNHYFFCLLQILWHVQQGEYIVLLTISIIELFLWYDITFYTSPVMVRMPLLRKYISFDKVDVFFFCLSVLQSVIPRGGYFCFVATNNIIRRAHLILWIYALT